MMEAIGPYVGTLVWVGIVFLIVWGFKNNRRCSCNRWKCGKCEGDIYK